MPSRHNTSPRDAAGWVIGVLALALLIPAVSVLVPNPLFFSAHGVTQLQAVGVIVVIVGLLWALLALVLHLLRRWLTPNVYDIVVSALTALAAGFAGWNVIARTVLEGNPWLALIPAAAVGVLIAALARRVNAGTILAVAAVAAAVVPLALVGGEEHAVAAENVATPANAPNVIWVIADELQYPIVMNADGDVRAQFPQLQALQNESTTYTRAFTTSNYTDFAVPAMLNGLTDISGFDPDRVAQMKASKGIASLLASNYAIIMESPLFNFACDGDTCVNVSPVNDGPVERVSTLVADMWAVVGRTSIAPPLDTRFPSLQGKWRDFWSPAAVDGRDGVVIKAAQVIKRIDDVETDRPGTPYLAFWHNMRTHGPWNLDRDGVQMYHSGTPVVEGSHSVGSQSDQTFANDDLIHMARRMYVNSTVEFDRQLGLLVEDLKSTGAYDNTMIIVTADHGVALTKEQERRLGDNPVERWSEIVHVPLFVKYPGQTTPERVTAPRATGQIAATVLDTIGLGALTTDFAPPLGQDPASIVFTDVGRPGMHSETFDPAMTLTDPWVPDDLTPPDPAHPFALNADLGLLDQPLPDGYTQTTDVAITALDGKSGLEVLYFDDPPAGCEANPALVVGGGKVLGSVLWANPNPGTGSPRGWSIVPRSNTYALACKT